MMNKSIDIVRVAAHTSTIANVDFSKICEESYQLPKIFLQAPQGSFEKSAAGYPFYNLPNTEVFNRLREEIETTANASLPTPVRLLEAWIAIVEPGQSIIYHTHYKNSHVVPEKHWSGVVFANSGEGSAELILHGYAFNRVESFISITPEVGKIVFFNSFVPHFTTVNDSGARRVSISFNLKPTNDDTSAFPNNHLLAPDNHGEHQ